MNLGKRLKDERERLGLSQTEFAGIAGAKKHAQINWEKGAASPNGKAFEAWAEAGVDVAYIITGQRVGPAEPLTPREQALVENYRASDESGRRAVEGAASAGAQPATQDKAG